MGDPHFFQSGAADLHIGISVVVGDMRQAYKEVVGYILMGKQPLKVVKDQGIVLPGVSVIDDGVDILDVHYPLVHQG